MPTAQVPARDDGDAVTRRLPAVVDVHPEGSRTREAPLGARPRILALDVLRGFALCGIILVNIAPVTSFGRELPPSPTTLQDPTGWLQLLVQQRFFPLFSLLFGISFSLLLESARQRGARERVVLLRRLIVLLPLGVLHQLLQPGEALTFYALFGLLILLPSTWLPRWAVALGAGLLVSVAVLLTGGGLPLVPGLLLLGSALVRYGVVDRWGSTTRGPAVLLLLFTVVAVPALVQQVRTLPQSGFSISSAVAGLALAGVYTTMVLLLLRTRLQRTLATGFRPLGRMALTNYVSATPLMLFAGHALDWPRSDSWAQLFLVAVGILVIQWVFSVLWLRRFRQGPLEYLWRTATWMQAQPMKRPVGTAAGAVDDDVRLQERGAG
ncbi:DUF418 domain-containing protein [Actinotalea sp. K2]|uniref:DUF418 domain-containing protein n=1 Tax=Actinotalea sp. K2 TaxID=2939438 RepID=UPI002017D27B|nr:DUF418 domain-containing protein [Actinotalea sp. K2]MCL3863296.1 DUF418 domain-containing protein [Actinotalea sp. K2]